MSELKRTDLGRNGTTDVIAFGLYQEGEEPVGVIYIGWDQALRQAAALGEAPEGELVRLAIHGTLHLLGYDHPEGADRERSEMRSEERRVGKERGGRLAEYHKTLKIEVTIEEKRYCQKALIN